MRKQLLYRIHTNSMYQQINANYAWQDWLNLRFGVQSCSELSITELDLTLDILLGNAKDGLNFKPDFIGRNLIKNANLDKAIRSNKPIKADAKKKITIRQFNKMLALAKELNFDDMALFRFALRQTRTIYINTEALKNINQEDATKIITGLEKIIKFKREKAR
ncbi:MULTISPECIES: regulatory protein GemA [Campylobacter]|uniref:regulatory protein GemA n=1 Tax=Campylobacter TaxID=194 RepID=UPI001E52C2F8|nr:MULTISPECIES: regulatory protein GemA [Campylobacter]